MIDICGKRYERNSYLPAVAAGVAVAIVAAVAAVVVAAVAYVLLARDNFGCLRLPACYSMVQVIPAVPEADFGLD